MKRAQVRCPLFDPLRCFTLQDLDQLRNRHGARQSAQHVYVVDPSADAGRRATGFGGVMSQHAEHLFADFRVLEIRPPLFGAEHDMQLYSRQGLRHVIFSRCKHNIRLGRRPLGIRNYWAEGPPVHPAQGIALGGVGADIFSFLGPTGQPFVMPRGERLVRWTDHASIQKNMVVFSVPQGVALGWENRCPFGANDEQRQY